MENKNFIFLGLGLLLCFNFVAWSAVFHLVTARPLKVVFLDVGQGDAAFIEIVGLYQILIDGGPGTKVLEKLSEQMPFYDRTIDLVLLTHPEKDHLEGLVEVLNKYQVDSVVWTGVLRETAVFEEWQKALENEKATIKIAKSGQKIIISKAILNILSPFENLAGVSLKDSNSSSIVSKLSFGQTSFFFTGDIYASEEKELINKGVDLRADVLKIAHHGSKTSTSEGFLQQVSPQLAVISVGENNNYGHPSPETLGRLEKSGAKILRTDENGDITITSDGFNLIINPKAQVE